MFPIVFEVEFEGDGMTNKAALKRYMRAALRGMLLIWHNTYFARHFKLRAFARYGGTYEKRVVTTAPRRGGQRFRAKSARPNYETGRMERQLATNFRISGTATGATLTMKGPPYTDAAARNQPDKAAEISHVARREADRLRREMHEFLVAMIAEDRAIRYRREFDKYIRRAFTPRKRMVRVSA